MIITVWRYLLGYYIPQNPTVLYCIFQKLEDLLSNFSGKLLSIPLHRPNDGRLTLNFLWQTSGISFNKRQLGFISY